MYCTTNLQKLNDNEYDINISVCILYGVLCTTKSLVFVRSWCCLVGKMHKHLPSVVAVIGFGFICVGFILNWYIIPHKIQEIEKVFQC